MVERRNQETGQEVVARPWARRLENQLWLSPSCWVTLGQSRPPRHQLPRGQEAEEAGRVGFGLGGSGGQQARRVTAGVGRPARARPGRLTHRAPPGRPYAAGSAGAASPPCRLGSSPGPGTRTCSWSGFPAWPRPAGAGSPASRRRERAGQRG